MYIENMAIIKDVESDYGIPFNYHKIKSVRIEMNPKDNQIVLIMKVASYVSKEARIQNKDAVYTECIIDNADFALTPFYQLLKAKFPDYSGADDFDNSFKGGDNSNPYKILIQQMQNGKSTKRVEGPDEDTTDAANLPQIVEVNDETKE